MSGRAQRDYATQKREEVEAKLREAKAGRTDSERERKMKEAVAKLKQLLPGALLLLCAHTASVWQLSNALQEM